MRPVTGIDPRITTPEMQTAYRYINQLAALGGQILGLLWAMATVKVNPVVAVAAGLGCFAYILYIGHDYRQQYAEITKAFTGHYRMHLILSAWPMLVVITIVSGLLSKKVSAGSRSASIRNTCLPWRHFQYLPGLNSGIKVSKHHASCPELTLM